MSKKTKDNMPDTRADSNSLPSAIAQMKTIKEVHDYYQKIISCMPNNVYWLDKNCVTQGCNANVLKFVGLKKPEEFIGITYEQMGKIAGWNQEHAQLYEHDDQEVMASKKPKLNSEDPPILNPDGTLTYYSSSRVPLFDDEHKEVIEVVGISVDITEQKQLLMDLKQAKERAELASQAKKEQQSLILQLTVTDTGVRIPKDKQQDIYVQFKRLTPSYQGIYKGAGLGLYVVKQFIDELGGEIYVDSEPHKGTVFTCLIPLQIPLLDNDAGVDTQDELKNPATLMIPLNQKIHALQPNTKASSKILVVEDNFIAQTVAKTLLSKMDCDVDVASNGVDALALYDKTDYDLIFMDIGLGEGLDGYEVTHHIRSKTSVTKHIPIIALTAHGGDENRQRCIEAGMDAVLTKPLTQAHAIDILKSFIPQRHETPTVKSSQARRDLPDNDDEMFQLNQFPILNSEQALKNCATQEMLNELLFLMTQKLPSDLDDMKKAFTAHDYPLVEKTAHKIKGGAVYVGTIRMKYACQYPGRP